MMTFFDLQQDDEFRLDVSRRIAIMTKSPYFILPYSFPVLYKYRSLSKFSVNDVVKGKITLTLIGTFNDLFDGAFHRYGSETERQQRAEQKWEKLEKLRMAARIPDQLLDHDDITNLYNEYYKKDSRLKFRQLDYLGTYVGCFSSQNDSTLMWAHYANSNSGICIAYDFNELDNNNLLHNTLFPVIYSQRPFDLKDLIDENKKSDYKYPLETAVLCSAMNKSEMWQYENEWRIIWVLAGSNEQWLSVNSLVKPHAIYFGYHFLKPLFYYSFKNREEKQKAINQKELLLQLLNYMEQNNIKPYVMVPKIGTYTLTPISITIEKMKELICQNFHDCGVDIKYYYVIHDQLMDLLEQ